VIVGGVVARHRARMNGRSVAAVRRRFVVGRVRCAPHPGVCYHRLERVDIPRVTVSHTGFQFDLALLGWAAMPDQRSLLRGRLANAIGDVVDVAAQLARQATRATAPPLPPPPLESGGRAWTLAAAMEPVPLIVEGIAAPRSSFGPIAPPPPPEH